MNKKEKNGKTNYKPKKEGDIIGFSFYNFNNCFIINFIYELKNKY